MVRRIYSIEVRHEGLKKYRHIQGADREVVLQKAHAQGLLWDEMWEKRQASESARAERQRLQAERAQRAIDKEQQAIEREQALEDARLAAEQRSTDAQAALAAVEQLLAATLNVDDAIDWDSLKDTRAFPEQKPKKPRRAEPQLPAVVAPPGRTDAKYQPEIGLLGKLLPSLKNKKILVMQALYDEDYKTWLEDRERRDAQYERQLTAHQRQVAQDEAEHAEAMAAYTEAERAYRDSLAAGNAAIDRRRDQYLAKDPGAILDYCEMVLSNSSYPDFVSKDFELDYLPDSGMLLVDYSIPPVHALPSLKDVKFSKSTGEKEVFVAEKDINAMYDSFVYQLALRSIHEIFEADRADAVAVVVFNGFVTSVDRATGNEATACILSLQAKKDEFQKINLRQVDPKACFRALKGVGSSKLHSITPVAPIIDISREDRRFVDGYAVAGALDESTNLATIPWEDFEHLIREVFAQEFAAGGGEVKVTQASRDGGVDAVAFDPDPIRGGKIVIQAKRYSNTVGVAAVRDLYGTVMNEGATKGILVTTSNYGPDAYEFAKGKPLSLLSGANLLHLLEKHGHKAKIDLKEAKGAAGR